MGQTVMRTMSENMNRVNQIESVGSAVVMYFRSVA